MKLNQTNILLDLTCFKCLSFSISGHKLPKSLCLKIAVASMFIQKINLFLNSENAWFGLNILSRTVSTFSCELSFSNINDFDVFGAMLIMMNGNQIAKISVISAKLNRIDVKVLVMNEKSSSCQVFKQGIHKLQLKDEEFLFLKKYSEAS